MLRSRQQEKVDGAQEQIRDRLALRCFFDKLKERIVVSRTGAEVLVEGRLPSATLLGEALELAGTFLGIHSMTHSARVSL